MLARNALDLSERTGAVVMTPYCDLAMAQTLTTRGDRRKAFFHVSRARQTARKMGSRLHEFQCYLWLAQAAIERSQTNRCIKFLQKALRLGKTEGYFGISFFRRDTLAQLCAEALEAEIEVDYVKELIRRYGLTPTTDVDCTGSWPWKVKVYTLGRFALLKDGKHLDLGAKSPRKPFELIKALICFGGEGVPESELSDALWPDADGDVAHSNFNATLHRLRKLIGHEAVKVSDRRLTLNPIYCWVDYLALNRVLKRINTANRQSEVSSLITKACRLYEDFLLTEEDAVCAFGPRERIDKEFKSMLEAHGDFAQKHVRPKRIVVAPE